MPEATQRSIDTPAVWEIDIARSELRIHGSLGPVGGRAFEIVAAPARSAGELVTKDQLMGLVWPGGMVGDNTLAVQCGLATADIRYLSVPCVPSKTEVGVRGWRQHSISERFQLSMPCRFRDPCCAMNSEG